jgi:hypothetical protein
MDLDRLAYFFDYELAQTLPETAYEELAQASREWRERWEHGPPPHLEYRWTPGLLQIHDNRRERSGTHTIEGIAADLYVACSDRPRTATAVHRTLKPPITVDQVQETLAEFTRLGLMLLDEDRALALALPATGGR